MWRGFSGKSNAKKADRGASNLGPSNPDTEDMGLGALLISSTDSTSIASDEGTRRATVSTLLCLESWKCLVVRLLVAPRSPENHKRAPQIFAPHSRPCLSLPFTLTTYCSLQQGTGTQQQDGSSEDSYEDALEDPVEEQGDGNVAQAVRGRPRERDPQQPRRRHPSVVTRARDTFGSEAISGDFLHGKLECYGVRRAGQARARSGEWVEKVCQDNIVFTECEIKGKLVFFAIVCDGHGKDGEEAADFVCEWVPVLFQEHARSASPKDLAESPVVWM